jgi:hypothetical protein
LFVGEDAEVALVEKGGLRLLRARDEVQGFEAMIFASRAALKMLERMFTWFLIVFSASFFLTGLNFASLAGCSMTFKVPLRLAAM